MRLDHDWSGQAPITGEVSRDDYDTLIQAAGRLPGVRLQGMTSLASSESRASLADQLLKQALEKGDVALRPQHGFSACARWSCC